MRTTWSALRSHARNDVRVLGAFLVHGYPSVRPRARAWVAAVLFGLTGCCLFLTLGLIHILIADGWFALGPVAVVFAGLPALLAHQGADYIRAAVGGPVYCVDCLREVTFTRKHRCHHRKGKRSWRR